MASTIWPVINVGALIIRIGFGVYYTTATALLKKSLVEEIEPLGQPCDTNKMRAFIVRNPGYPGLGVPISYFALSHFVFAGVVRTKRKPRN